MSQLVECNECFEQIMKWWSRYAVEPVLEETMSLLVDVSPTPICVSHMGDEGGTKTYHGLHVSTTPDASQMKHGLRCVRDGEVILYRFSRMSKQFVDPLHYCQNILLQTLQQS